MDTNNIYSNAGCVVFVPPPELSPPFVYFSGTLIHPRVLLTAGHTAALLQNIPAMMPLLRISFGAYALDPSTWHEIETAFVHPDYNPIHNQSCNDVGVIILEEPIYDVPLATLSYEGFLDDLKAAQLLRQPGEGGVPFIVAGYGTTLEWPPPEIIPPDGWRRFAYTDYLALTPGWLFNLINPATGNGGTGYGDSGGPVFWIDTDGTLVLMALTGHGDPYGLATTIAWRVDIAGTLDFIDWVIDSLGE